MSGLDTFFLAVSAHALLKIVTKGSFGCKKSENLAFLGYFSKQKRRSTTNINDVFLIILKHSYPVQTHTFWKLVHVFFVHNILVAIGGCPPAGHLTLVLWPGFLQRSFNIKKAKRNLFLVIAYPKE